MEPSLAIPLCKFRCINHRLLVVAGRYSNIPRAERICNLCTDVEVGDEFHYIFNCSHFYKERLQFINPKYMNGANISKIKLKHLFNTESESELLNLAMFNKNYMGKFSETHCQASNVKSKSKTSQKMT